MKNKRKWLFVLIVTCVLVIAIGLLRKGDTDEHTKRLAWTQTSLLRARDSIEAFTEATGRYPNSLAEMLQYGQEHVETKVSGHPFLEYISDTQGCGEEHAVLNGEGGWYYNKETGEVSVNLTKRLKDYIGPYFGKHRNDIPADW